MFSFIPYSTSEEEEKNGIISLRIANDIQELLATCHQIREAAEFLASPFKENRPKIGHIPIIQK